MAVQYQTAYGSELPWFYQLAVPAMCRELIDKKSKPPLFPGAGVVVVVVVCVCMCVCVCVGGGCCI